MEARLRQLAAERGLDPNFWAKVVEGESRWNPAARARTPKEDSGGLLQLNTKNGVGVAALKAGINPHDPTQWEQQLAFGLDHAKKHGHRDWTVARQLKGERTPGIPVNPVARSVAAQPAAKPTATAAEQKPQYPDSPLVHYGPPTPDPFQQLANERKEKQAQQAIAQLQAQIADRPPPEPAPPPQPMLPPVDYSTLLLPRLRRGLLADQSLGLLGAG
jgi:hypothetical protein